MFLNILSNLNRNVSHKSGICLLPQTVYKTKIDVNYIHTVVTKKNDKSKQKSDNNVSRKEPKVLSNLKPFYRKNYANQFGPLKDKLDKMIPQDAGDIAEEEYLKNIPLRSDQLPMEKYKSMVEQHIKNKRLKDAIDVLEVKMKNDRVQPVIHIYEMLILECGRLGYTKKAFQLFNRAKERGLRISNSIYGGLFNACANGPYSSNDLKLAINLRKLMIRKGIEPTEINYSIMIKAFGRCGDIKTAFELVDEMKDNNNMSISLYTMNHLLQACIEDKEHGFRHALLVWHKIYQGKLLPNIHSFNLMLRCIRECGMGDMDSIRSVLTMIFSASQKHLQMKIMKENKGNVLLIGNKATKSINQMENKAIERVHHAVDDKVEEKSCDQMPNLLGKLPHLGSLVELNEVKTTEDRLFILGGLSGFIKEMELTKVRPNSKTFSQLMYGIASTRAAEHELIEKMREVRVRADISLFNTLIKRRILREDFEGAKIVLELIDKVQLEPDIVTYGTLALGCRTRKEAQEFLGQLKEKNIKPNNQILGALLKNVRYVQDDGFAADILKCAMEYELKPDEGFTKMANLYNSIRFTQLSENTDKNDEQWTDYYNFRKTYVKWQEHVGIYKRTLDETKKIVRERPWDQFKDNERDGAEMLKNSKLRHYWPRQHGLMKLNPKRLQRVHESTGKKIEDPNDKFQK